MKNTNKLKRCLDYLKNNNEKIVNNFNDKVPSEKEQLLLNYLNLLKNKLKEKYNSQFCELFIDEYGFKKNICSSIIQIYFPFDTGNNYKEIYELIKNYFSYEIILRKKIETLLIPSVSLVFDWKIADCADLSTIVVSSLRVKNYEAYVVCGEAPFSICSRNDKKNFCEFSYKKIKLPKGENENIEDIKDKKKKYEQLMGTQKILLTKNTFEKDRTYLEKDVYIHMWILIKKSLDLEKDIFIEMATGREYDINDCPYRSIFYLWNEKNVYINIKKTKNIEKLISEIYNQEYFTPAFFEEIKYK
ncbi:conserved protein, unknown function, partial [Hepatocystis sp. ex Piliocolobus tephrosceles]